MLAAAAHSTNKVQRPHPLPGSGSIFHAAHRMMMADATPGRTITCGFTYLQRVGRGATMRLWQPNGRPLAPGQLDRIEWAACRQVEILQEASAQSMESMDIEEGLRSIREHAMMRAGGLRLAIITAGTVERPDTANDQKTFDRTLRERLRNMDRMHWLEEFSRSAARVLQQSAPDIPSRLPHIYTTLNAADVFGRVNSLPFQDTIRLLDKVGALTEKHAFEHDIMVGLKEPRSDANAQRKFNRLSERLYGPFINSLIATYNIRSGSNLMPAAIHMRSFGDHMKFQSAPRLAPSQSGNQQQLVYS